MVSPFSLCLMTAGWGRVANLLVLGHMNFGRFDYADESGYNLDNQVLVFKISF